MSKKPKFRFWNGQWWCGLLGVNGCGESMDAAWDDMWTRYAYNIRPVGSWYQGWARA